MTLPVLAWLDFAERDRRRMLDVVKLFREQDTRDELGIGSVRDALSDTLFPGTNTIMTRARYFLFVPWVYLRRERLEGAYQTKSTVAEKARSDEIYLIRALKSGGESTGVIGIDAQQNLQRLPSSIYWGGLERLGIKRFSMSIAEYHRWLSSAPAQADRGLADDDGEPVAGYSQHRWDPALPDPPGEWLTATSFDLARAEAEYLRERIVASNPTSLLAFLVDHADPVNDSVSYVWMHPQLSTLPPHLRDAVENARLFSLVIHGAAWLYNLLLAEAQGSADLAARHRDSLVKWADTAQPSVDSVRDWDLEAFWVLTREANPGIGHRAVRFVEAWVSLVRGVDRLRRIADDPACRDLIAARERELKRSRSRLDNRRLLEVWQGSSGTGRLDFRWNPVVREVTNDILHGLSRDDTYDA